MKSIVFGSGNRTRLQRFRQLLEPLDLEVLGPADLGGKTPEENATTKATVYFSRAGIPTFATDYALYIDKFPPEKQPGILVRRIFGGPGNATDAELLDYYCDALSKVGGESETLWIAAVALVLPPGRIFTRRLTERTLFTNRRSPTLTPGEPLNSLQIVPSLGKYKSEMTAEERAHAQLAIDQGVVEFVSEHLDGENVGTRGVAG